VEPSEPAAVAATDTEADHDPRAVVPSVVVPAARDTGAGEAGAVKSAGGATATRRDVLAT